MDERVGFKDNTLREEFFLLVRKESKVTSWDKVAARFGLRRTHFQEYQYGYYLMPKILFDEMNALLPQSLQENFKEKIFIKQHSWGAVEGGIVTSKRYPQFIKKARDVAVLRIKQKALEKPLVNIPLSIELCEFVGALIGDGSVEGFLQKRNGLPKYHLFITGHLVLDLDYLTRYQLNIIKQLFGLDCKITFRKNCNALVLHLYSKRVFCLFTERFDFKPGNKIYTTKIPEEILSAGEKYTFATIRGIFDTDGCIFFDKRGIYGKPYPRIVIQIASAPLYFQLKEILGRHFSIYASKKRNRRAYCVEIYGHNQFEKWMKLIGFSNKKHLNRIVNNLVNKVEAGIEPAASTLLASNIDTNVAVCR